MSAFSKEFLEAMNESAKYAKDLGISEEELEEFLIAVSPTVSAIDRGEMLQDILNKIQSK